MSNKIIVEKGTSNPNVNFNLFQDDWLNSLLDKVESASNSMLLRVQNELSLLVKRLSLNTVVPALAIGRRSIPMRIGLCWIITWPMLMLLSLIDNVGLGNTARESFLIDFAAYAQLWVGIPLFLSIERYIDTRLKTSVEWFKKCGIIEDPKKIDEIVNKKSPKVWVFWEVATVLSSYAMTWSWLFEELNNLKPSWHALLYSTGERLTFAGLWAGFIAVPLWNYFLFRFAVRVCYWYSYLWDISKLDLKLQVLHPDRAGGLGFLGRLQGLFGIIIFAVGCVVAATVGYKIQIENQVIWSYATLGPILAFVILAPTFFLLPLFFFSSIMLNAKDEMMFEYGIRIGQASVFVKKEDEVGSKMYDLIKQMRVVPFDLKTLLQLIGSAVGPMIPLISSFLPGVAKIMNFIRS